MTKKSVALILAKKNSTRLPGKNTLDFHGKPMFMVNVDKCLSMFDRVYVSSDDPWIIKKAESAGAVGILRGDSLIGDVPNIPVYLHALTYMGTVDNIVAVQSCSPTISAKLILTAKQLLEIGYQEVMTCHPIEHSDDYHEQGNKIYGSVWGLSREKLQNYPNPYKPTPDVLLVDTSIDIHNQEDYQKALCL